VLAGEPWSDRPRGTHPALAEVARLVNDGSSEHGRSALLPMAAELTGAGGRDARVAPSLVVLAVEYAGRERGANRKGQAGWTARRDLARARRRLRALDADCPRAGLHRLTDPLYRRGPAQRALARAATSISRGTPPRRAGSAPDVAADARLRHCWNARCGSPGSCSVTRTPGTTSR